LVFFSACPGTVPIVLEFKVVIRSAAAGRNPDAIAWLGEEVPNGDGFSSVPGISGLVVAQPEQLTALETNTPSPCRHSNR
jgi:hypothetical protein